MCGVKLKDRKRTSELMLMLELSEDIVTVVGWLRLRWYGHVMKKDLTDGVRRMLDVEIADVVWKGQPHLEWRQVVEKIVLRMGLQCSDMLDRPK
jgi:hypothetical protein